MSHSLLSAAALALVISYASSFSIVGYVNTSNVIEHLRLDLDQTALNTAAGLKDFSAAYTIYSTGEATHKNALCHEL